MYKLNKNNTKVEVEVSIDNAEWEKGVDKVYESSKAKFNVVGFRKGHAPRKVIEKQYGDSVFFDDAIQYFIEKTLNEVLDENPELEPVSMPTTQFESYTVENGLKMKILFEIVPDFELCDYKGAEIEVHEAKATDADVDHQIHHLLEDNAKFESVEREVKVGDSAVIDFTGYIDGVAFEGGAGEDYALEIGSHSFIDTFEDQLVGHKKGDEVDVNVTFPENYHAEEFKGKKALFKVTIKDVREKTLPELTDKFIADTTEFETVEEYRKDAFAHIEDMKAKQMEDELQYNIRQYLLKNTKLEIPEVMVEGYIKQDIQRMEEALKMYGVSFEDYLVQTGSNIEEYMTNAKARTLTSIQARYLYRKVIEQNKIEVSAEELAKATEGVTDQNAIARKENELLLDKVFKVLKDSVKIKYVKD